MNSNYGGLLSLPNKLKFDHINICTNLLIMEEEISNTCPLDRLICFKCLNVETFCTFELTPDVRNILVTGDILETALHWKRI